MKIDIKQYQIEVDKDIEIDILSLEQEWMQQPQLYMKHARANADAIMKRDMLKSQLNKSVRNHMTAAGIKKISESSVIAEIETDTDYISACYIVHITAGAVRSMDQKKAALGNEVELYKGEYFSLPRDPPEYKDISLKEKRLQQISTNQRRRLNKKE